MGVEHYSPDPGERGEQNRVNQALADEPKFEQDMEGL